MFVKLTLIVMMMMTVMMMMMVMELRSKESYLTGRQPLVMMMMMVMKMILMDMRSRASNLTGRHPMVKSLASSKNVSNKDSKSWNTKYKVAKYMIQNTKWLNT